MTKNELIEALMNIPGNPVIKVLNGAGYNGDILAIHLATDIPDIGDFDIKYAYLSDKEQDSSIGAIMLCSDGAINE